MILVGIGASLPAPDGSPPIETCRAAGRALGAIPGVTLTALSRWWESAPVPPMAGAPNFVNGVARLEGDLAPEALLDALQAIEARFGRTRPYPNAPRTLDLDLLDHNGRVLATERLTLPHPRMAGRAFVLRPLAEVAPDWKHPVSGLGAEALLAALPPQEIAPLPGDAATEAG
jgi:2-amino-4-hydroxy-6-hydroxymethyldihydropteridine diphosphokinase